MTKRFVFMSQENEIQLTIEIKHEFTWIQYSLRFVSDKTRTL